MTSESLPKRFYRLIYFAPRPEDDERVCVALVVWDDGRTHYLYDEKARKARSLSREYNPEAILFVLRSLELQAERIALTGSVPEFSPQVQVSEPRVLLKSMTSEIRDLLFHTYLAPQKGYRAGSKQLGLGRRIEQFVSKLAISHLSIDRRVSAEELLGKENVRRLPLELVPRQVSRVVHLKDSLLLIDGVDVHSSTADTLVDHVGRIVHTFWQYRQAKTVLHDPKVNVVSAALVFDGVHGLPQDESLDWRRRYATEQFEKDADFTVTPTDPDGENRLRQLLSTAQPS